jgi:hypothetical protein
MDKEALLNDIRSAFSGVTLEGGMGLYQAQAIDDYECYETQEEARLETSATTGKRFRQRCFSSVTAPLAFLMPRGCAFICQLS